MALTSTLVNRLLPGDLYRFRHLVTFDNSYATGGESLTAAILGISRIVDVEVVPSVGLAGLICYWDRPNAKLQLFHPSGGSAAPATLVAPTVVTTPDAGGTTMTGSAAKPALSGVVTAGIGKEVASTTDCSTITVEIIVYGYL
jgi:hypothetical protein